MVNVCTYAGINNGCVLAVANCSAGMRFQQCGPLCPQTCGTSATCNSGCAEGCFCPPGLVADENQQCVKPTTCPGQ